MWSHPESLKHSKNWPFLAPALILLSETWVSCHQFDVRMRQALGDGMDGELESSTFGGAPPPR